MKQRFVLALAACAAALAAATAAPVAPAHPLSLAAPARTCPANFTHAIIGGREKCLHAGEFCAVRYQRQYRHYGFYCSPTTHRLRSR